MGPQTFNFSSALELMKQGATMSRIGWKNPGIKVRVQFPDAGSANTEPYLYMVKDIPDQKMRRFPLDLSCESIFADDWIEVSL